MANIYNMAEEEGVKEQYPLGTKITFKNRNGISSGTVMRIDIDSRNDKTYFVKFTNTSIDTYYIKVSESNIIGISAGGRKKSHRRKQKSRKHKSRRHVNKRGVSR